MKQIFWLALQLALLTTINQSVDDMNVDVHLWCDDYLVVFWSDDNFATQNVEKTPINAQNSIVGAQNALIEFSFVASRDATIRIGCWDTGYGRYLKADGYITVDEVTYVVSDMVNDGDLELIGFEPNTCGAVPNTIINFSETNSLTTTDTLALMSNGLGYWPAAETTNCGVFWADFTPQNEMNVEVDLRCDNFPALFYSMDNFVTFTTVKSPLLDANNRDTSAGNIVLSFTAPKGATFRIGCWDYGKPGRLMKIGTITVDGTKYTIEDLVNNNDLKLVGFEETCTGFCVGGQQCLDDLPQTLSDPGSVTPLAPDDKIVQHSTSTDGYWVQSKMDICGVFYADFTPYPFICPTADADTFDWYTLTRDGTNIPVVIVNMDVDPLDLSLNIDVIVEYIVTSSESDQEIQGLGTTYILDFEDFDAHKSKISEPNTCSNRLQSVYNGLTTDNQRFEITSDKFDAIGTPKNMCYPPPGGATTGWEIIKEESDCNTITYRGKWQWKELRECRNNGNSPRLAERDARQTEVIETTDYIELSGVFYVNMVSPFWNVNNDLYRNYYRVYQLVSQPFLIQVSKSVYVIGSTGINVMTMSIVAVYKEDLDTDYTLILLTEAAEYMMLQNPVLIPPTDEGQTDVKFTLEMQQTADTGSGNDDCLNPKSYICSQMWKVFAVDTECTNTEDGIDFSGTYRIKFAPLCRAGDGDGGYDFTNVCNTWLTDHPDFEDGVQLQSELTFVDKICDIRTFEIQLEADMIFYEEEEIDPQFQTAIIAANANLDYLFQAGESMVYGEIITRFPSTSGSESIFGSELVNVWLCTFPPGTVPDSPDEENIQDYKDNNNVGCFSSNRDGGDTDNFFFHVYDSQNTDQPEGFEVLENGDVETNRIRFKFKVPRKIQRDTLYVHAQVQVTLQQETARRRVLLDVSHGPISNKMAHFGKNIGITNQPYKKPEPELPPQQPQYPQQPNNYYPQPIGISLNSTWIIIIGGLLSIILTFNIIFMCYMNCCKGRNGRRPRVSFSKNRRSGYDSVKHIDSEEFDDSEANLINVN